MGDRRTAGRRRFDKEREATIAAAIKLESASPGAGEAYYDTASDALAAIRRGLGDRLRRNGVESRTGGAQ